MKDFFPSDVMRPNPECSNAQCRKQQAAPEHANWTPMVWKALGHDGQENMVVEHDDNEWGIELGGDDDAAASSVTEAPVAAESSKLASGLTFAYEQPSAASAADAEENSASVADVDVSLEDLMGQLKSL
ncbi:hypothetical protein ON010_g10057 [Phytophthora cinnamomi]|nr:hypothetical protein ON010_g10057 [Phytophthora cinnamomi]